MHTQQSVVSAALRAVGNIVTGDDIQTQVPRLLINPVVSGSIDRQKCWQVWGRCYDHGFKKFSVKNWQFFLQTNVVVNFSA
jgi:hypothetical protein